jgi:DNA topoisomerase-1
MKNSTELIRDPKESAKEAGLRYYHERQLRINRAKRGESFEYFDKEGKKITDKETIARIDALVLPPAWEKVVISPADNSHLQAIGVDEKGRKQYRYHPEWNKFRDKTKYEKMVSFGKALPKIRSRVSEDMNKQGLPREKVLATIVKLMEKTMIRIGNEQYAKENKSYGLTTLRNKHVEVGTYTIQISFKGKSNKFHDIEIRDRRLARMIGKLQDLPGQELFQYVTDYGEIHSVSSADVNEYIQAVAGDDFTAKDFRTWRGTVLAAVFLGECERATTIKENKKIVTDIVKKVASELGNTPTVCRKCYIHPLIIESFISNDSLEVDNQSEIEIDTTDLLPEEKVVLKFLKQKTT